MTATNRRNGPETTDHETIRHDRDTFSQAATQDAASKMTWSRGSPSRKISFMLCLAIPVSIMFGVGAYLTPTENSSTKDSPKHLYAALERLNPSKSDAKNHTEDVNRLVLALEQRLQTEPNDIDGWRVLGWSHYRNQKFARAADAYHRAAKLDTESAILRSLHGEALVAAAKGKVTEDAAIEFRAALERDPLDVRARYFLGEKKLQDGKKEMALNDWIALLKASPAGADWSSDLRARIVEVANNSGINVSQDLPRQTKLQSPDPAPVAAPNVTQQDIKNAKSMTQSERQEMAQSMVSRLAERLRSSPRDANGWIMLIRSRVVLKQKGEAKKVLEQALKVFADDEKTRTHIRMSARALKID